MKIILDTDKRTLHWKDGKFDNGSYDQQKDVMNLAAVLLTHTAKSYFRSRKARRLAILRVCGAALDMLDSQDGVKGDGT